MNAKLRGIARSGTEIILSIAWVVAFFLVFLALLSVTFPEGTSLSRLAADGSRPTRDRTREAIDLQAENVDEELVAMLAYKRHKVKHKPADFLAWADSRTGMPLHNRHSVQTLSHSAATIAFDAAEMKLGENSLVVVKSFERDRAAQVDRAAVVVLDGELRGSIEPGADSLMVEVVTGNDSRIRPYAEGGKPANFSVSVGEDGSAVVSVYEGQAEVTALGNVVLVEENQALTVDPSGTVSKAAEEIPSAPRLSKNEKSRYLYGTQPPRVRFDWEKVSGVNGYSFVLARDREMTDVVYQIETESTELVHGNLEAGEYFWTVRARRGAVRSVESEVGRVRLVRDTDEPTLLVTFPPAHVLSSRATVSGTAERNSKVWVADELVEVGEDGRFEREIKLRKGLNVVVVEAVDAAGNASYRSQVIQATY